MGLWQFVPVENETTKQRNNETTLTLTTTTTTTHMTNKEMKTMAHSLKMECIIDGDGDVCIREMHFDDGVRQVRHYPDPCEFSSRELAIAKLKSPLPLP